MRSLRLPGETDQGFRLRAERTVIIAKHLIDAALANYCIQHFIADPALPYSIESVRRNPTVRVDYEEAFAISGIGEGLCATKSKHWGEGPNILPLEPTDPVDPMFILYIFKDGSLYNRRFKQRRRMKELLGRKHRKLVERAKYKRFTKGTFMRLLTSEEETAIRDRLRVEPALFRRLARGQVFLDLPLCEIQLRLPFRE